MKGAPIPPISTTNTALVIHDMQKDFLQRSMSTPETRGVIERTRRLLDRARAISIPVIYTRVESDPNITFPSERAAYLRADAPVICVKGTEGAEVVDELRPHPSDHIITKVRSSAFHETRLETLLRVKGVWCRISDCGD